MKATIDLAQGFEIAKTYYWYHEISTIYKIIYNFVSSSRGEDLNIFKT